MLQAIDSGKHRRTEAVVGRLRPPGSGGIPWMAIVDGEGACLITSDAPKGNIGCPYEPHEIAWFRTMLEKTCSRLKSADLDAIQKANEAWVDSLKKRPPK